VDCGRWRVLVVCREERGVDCACRLLGSLNP
jgi:hypothetical protein